MSDAGYRTGALAVPTVAFDAAAAIQSRSYAGGITQKSTAEALEAVSRASDIIKTLREP
jgi:hypothetical protein